MIKQKQLTIILTTIISTFGLSACLLDKEATDAASIRTADVTLTSPIALSKSDFLEELSDIEEFKHKDDDYDFFSASDSESDEFEKCLLDNFGDTKFTAGTTQGVRLDADFTNAQNCFGKTFSTMSLDKISLSILLDNVIMVDQSGNAVTLLNNTMKTASALKIKEGNFRMWFEIAASVTSAQGTISFIAKSAASQNHINGIDLPCKYANPINNCRSAAIFSISSSSTEIPSGQQGHVLIAKNLYYTDGQPYHYDGVIDFEVNDWKGEMQYGSTGNDIPTFTATNGTETAIGSYTGANSTKPAIYSKVKQILNAQVNDNLNEKINSFVKQSLINAVIKPKP